ncbi:hypothetical protein [Streptomyces sp. NPDC054901]
METMPPAAQDGLVSISVTSWTGASGSGENSFVLAALLRAARALSTRELAAALDWPQARAEAAVRAAEHRPEVCGPLTLRRTPSGAHLVTAQHRRLTQAQRTALARRPGD